MVRTVAVTLTSRSMVARESRTLATTEPFTASSTPVTWAAWRGSTSLMARRAGNGLLV